MDNLRDKLGEIQSDFKKYSHKVDKLAKQLENKVNNLEMLTILIFFVQKTVEKRPQELTLDGLVHFFKFSLFYIHFFDLLVNFCLLKFKYLTLLYIHFVVFIFDLFNSFLDSF